MQDITFIIQSTVLLNVCMLMLVTGKLTEGGSAKFFVLEDGSTIIQNRGVLNDREILKIQKFIKLHYLEMYEKWAKDSENGFFGEKK